MRLDRNQCELNVGIERIDEGRKNELCKIDRSLLNDSSRASNNANNQLESISYRKEIFHIFDEYFKRRIFHLKLTHSFVYKKKYNQIFFDYLQNFLFARHSSYNYNYYLSSYRLILLCIIIKLACFGFVIGMKNDGTSIIVTNLSSIIIDNHINNNNNLKNFPITATLRIRRIYTNQYAVKISGGNKNEAEQLAKKYGFINLGPIIPNDEYYLFELPTKQRRSSRRTRSIQASNIAHEPHVVWIEQQIAKKRVKRGFKSHFSHEELDNEYHIRINKKTSIRNKQNNKDVLTSNDTYNLNDPLWADMWYLNRAVFDRGMDHNVREAWALGYTGRGVVVTILDDGLERTHPDIAPNYDAKASYDVNDRDDDPTPRYDYTDENRHGTRCAGEVAAIFNNSLCIVGIAYNSRIGGIRMLDGDVTDAVEANSLGHNSDHIDIYSASWGPDDDGRTVDGPAKLTRRAFEKGIREGRGGLGSIFVWASGNGGKDADSCNCDGYTNSIYTLSISSATENGNVPWYSEACSSTLATAYSSGASGERMILTTDLHHSCTNSHTGTSASAPLAAGIVALTLEANPKLTWRDMQHIVVRTAQPSNLRAGDWVMNGVGRNVSHSFGYGLMDAGAMVKLAAFWTTVPEQKKCTISYPGRYKSILQGNRLQLQLYSDGCAMDPRNMVMHLEHVQAIITLTAPKRGDIEIYLTSPSGTKSVLLAKRSRDTSPTGFRDWAFMTTHNWGEMAIGLWTLEIDNDSWDDAQLVRWDLVLYGTSVKIGANGRVHSSSLAARSISKDQHPEFLTDDLHSVAGPCFSFTFVLLNLFICGLLLE